MTMKQTKKQFIGISYDELLSENARLREEFESVGIAAYSYGRGDLKTENAKLRELCKAWREFAYEIFDERFGEPELNDEFMALDDRMRESGMEVDG